MPSYWDDDLDDIESAADMFEKDPRSELVTVWLVEDETDAIIVSDLLEENNIVASLVPASEAGKYAAMGHPDSIHIQVSEVDAAVAVEALEEAGDLPGTPRTPDEDLLLDEQEPAESSEESDEPV